MCRTNNKIDTFENLVRSIQQCNLCNRMVDRKKVLSKLNGNIDSKVLFIAEAPGRLGAECTGIPLYGDKTGENFEMLLSNIGWSRDDIFITNAVLCNPQDENGNNATPTICEIQNCSYYLEMMLEFVNPDVIITLGIKALEALKQICHHNYTLKSNVSNLLHWNNRYIFPLYHMSPRAAIHRSLIQQRADFIKLSHIVNPKTGMKQNRSLVPSRSNANVASKLTDILVAILEEMHSVSFFKLTKLLYLIDYNFLLNYGHSISGSIYLRMQEGPWIPNLKNCVQEFDNKFFSTSYIKGKPILKHILNDYQISLDEGELGFIKELAKKYKEHSDAEMKIAVYRTKPMRYILEQENLNRFMLKTPVLYKDMTVIDMDKYNH